MVKLTVDKMPSALSPSSLNAYEGMPNTAFLQRLVPPHLSMPREPQGKAAAIGTAFDILVKKYLMAQGVKRLQTEPLEGSLERFHDEAYELGGDVLDVYLRSNALEGRVFDHVDSSFVIDLPALGGKVSGKPDAALKHPLFKNPIALDWKVVGSNAKAGMSPRPGYCRVFKDGEWKGPHKSLEGTGRNIVPAFLVDDKWAMQCCTYNWMLGWGIEETSYAIIHSPVFNGKDRKIIIAEYMMEIPKEFSIETAGRYKALWDDLKSGRYVDRLASSECYDLVAVNTFGESWF